MSHNMCLSLLTHWSPNKMADIFQTAFSKEFSPLRMYGILIRMSTKLELKVQWMITQHWLRQWIVKQQTITRTNGDLHLRRHMVPLCNNELNKHTGKISSIDFIYNAVSYPSLMNWFCHDNLNNNWRYPYKCIHFHFLVTNGCLSSDLPIRLTPDCDAVWGEYG